MASSARFLLRGVALAAVLTGLSGCVTTMEKNARTLVLNQRALASEGAVEVTRANPSIKVLGVSVVHGSGMVALLVRLLNTSYRPLSDLPISVGIRTTTGKRIYLNRVANSAYFDAHVAAIGGRETTTWVYTTRRLPGAPGRPFAAVGFPHLPATTTVSRLPSLAAVPRGGVVHGALRVTVSNRSGIPQYGLQVCAVALRGGRASAAAQATLSELDGGASRPLLLHLVGDVDGARLQLYVLPTIFT